MSTNSLPFVSFVIPTYNAQRFLGLCLKSVVRQDYPKDKYEILVVDGRSTDDTIQIAKMFGAKIIDNPHRDPESAKSLGIQKADGQVIALLDSDNEIASSNWLRKMVVPLVKDHNLFGVESFYFPKTGESIFNTYSMIAHIADPFSRCLACKLIQKNKKDYIEYTIPPGSTYPLGANGFLWNRKIIEEVGLYKPKFEESNFSYFVLEKGYRRFARVAGCGIYHYHIESLSDFIEKRVKIGNKFLRRKEEKRRTWLEGVGQTKFFLCALWCGTVIGPAVESVVNLVKTGQKAWLLHPLLSLVSVVSYTLVFLKRKFLPG